MAVQKSRKTPSKRGMHRSHSALPLPAVSIDAKSGETHSRHRISRGGFARRSGFFDALCLRCSILPSTP